MSKFFTYGTKEADFEKLKREISTLFQVELEEHESIWWGIYALGKHAEIGEIKLYPNYVQGEGYHVNNHSYKYLLAMGNNNMNGTLSINSIIQVGEIEFELLMHREA